MSPTDRKVEIVFGAGGIGNVPGGFTYTWTSPSDVNLLLSTLKHNDIRILDSAANYPPGAAGDTNRLLGLSHACQSPDFDIDTKIGRPKINPGRGMEGTLTRTNITRSVDEDLELLKGSKIRCLYAHGPDKSTSHAETAAAFDEQVRLGHCEFYGLCNYSVSRLREYIQVCKENNYALPKIYQGWYNAIHRFPEPELLSLCRDHGMKFYAYSPLSGGFLTGKVTAARTASASTTNANPDGSETSSSVLYRTRFDKTSMLQQYNLMYDHEEIHAAMLRFKESCESLSPPISTAEASLRWVFYHSALGEGDAVIIGAKTTEQLQGNLDQIEKGPLSAEAVKVVERLWEETGSLIDSTLGFES